MAAEEEAPHHPLPTNISLFRRAQSSDILVESSCRHSHSFFVVITQGACVYLLFAVLMAARETGEMAALLHSVHYNTLPRTLPAKTFTIMTPWRARFFLLPLHLGALFHSGKWPSSSYKLHFEKIGFFNCSTMKQD